MNPRERKAEMILKGVSQAEIAEELEVTQQHVSAVILGLRRSALVEAMLAAKLGLSVDEVFPPTNADTEAVG